MLTAASPLGIDRMRASRAHTHARARRFTLLVLVATTHFAPPLLSSQKEKMQSFLGSPHFAAPELLTATKYKGPAVCTSSCGFASSLLPAILTPEPRIRLWFPVVRRLVHGVEPDGSRQMWYFCLLTAALHRTLTASSLQRHASGGRVEPRRHALCDAHGKATIPGVDYGAAHGPDCVRPLHIPVARLRMYVGPLLACALLVRVGPLFCLLHFHPFCCCDARLLPFALLARVGPLFSSVPLPCG